MNCFVSDSSAPLPDPRLKRPRRVQTDKLLHENTELTLHVILNYFLSQKHFRRKYNSYMLFGALSTDIKSFIF